jgi:hypothetical protein
MRIDSAEAIFSMSATPACRSSAEQGSRRAAGNRNNGDALPCYFPMPSLTFANWL